MNALEKSIEEALKSKGDQQKANKAYLEFLKANFIIPIERRYSDQEEPQVLFYQDDQHQFLPVFSSMRYFDQWANEIQDSIEILNLSGVDLLKGIGDTILVCLNIGSPIYKEFNTSEIARMKSMVLKIFKD